MCCAAGSQVHIPAALHDKLTPLVDMGIVRTLTGFSRIHGDGPFLGPERFHIPVVCGRGSM